MKKLFHYILLLFVFFVIFFYLKKIILKDNVNITTNSSSSPHLNIYADINHLGINACKDCHFDIYETFIGNGMGRSFNYAKKEYSSSIFDSILYDKKLDISYYPHWNNDSLFVNKYYHKFDLIDSNYIDYIIGSGHHTNSHIINQNGYLYQAPFTFYTQDSILDFPPGFESGNNSRFEREIGLECMTCHNAYPDFVLGSTNKFNKIPKGIDCERCHGPGELHVNSIESGNLVDTSIYFDYTIVNPASLSIELQNEICSRCHIQGNSVLQYDKSFYDFRPGMYLNEVMDIYFPRYENAEDEFIMASHVDRLKQSECFIKSDNKISCIDCHNPHKSVHQADPAIYNSTCFSCHNNNDCNENFENKEKLNNNCVSCHMRESSTIDIPHVTITDHKISIPNEKINHIEKKFKGLECVNNDNPSVYSIANAYLQEYDRFSQNPAYLDSAFNYLRFIDMSTKEGLYSSIYYFFLSKEFNKISEIISDKGKDKILEIFNVKQYNNFDAWTCYRIGQVFYNQKKYKTSILFFDQATKLSPYNLKFLDKYGNNLILIDQFDDAKLIFQSIINENNQYVSAYNNLSRLYFKQYLLSGYEGDKNLSNYYCDIALNLDPINKKGLLNKIDLIIIEKKYSEAKLLLSKIIDIYPDEKDAKLLLNKLNEENYKNI
tara:strand:- start:1443 stop:3425 length:1983 start_codon:yes stop_codon:yes gene_type:complete